MIQRSLALCVALAAGCSLAAGAQSTQVTAGTYSATLPATAPWTTLGSPSQAMRVEVRMHDFPSGTIPLYPIAIGSMEVMSRNEPDGNRMIGMVNGPDWKPLFNCCGGWNDVLVRMQRDVARGKITVEVFNVQTGATVSGENTITGYGQASWGGQRIVLRGGSAAVGFIRWYSSVVPVGTPIPVAGAPGDLGDWEFDGDLRDSSGHGLNLTADGSASALSYMATPVAKPHCAVQPTEQTARAGYAAQLDGSLSQPLDGNVGLVYSWQQTAGPTKAAWSSKTMARPLVSGLVAGQYDFQLTVADSAGRVDTCAAQIGAVATDDNGVVITNNPVVDKLLGPIMIDGKSPWPWYEDRNKAAAVMQTQVMEQHFPAWWDTPQPGTVSVSGSVLTGNGTSFTTQFCNGAADPTTGNGSWVAFWYELPGGGTGRYQAPVDSCESDTKAQLSWYPPTKLSTLPFTGMNYSVGPGSVVWNIGRGNSSMPWNYYDNVVAFYSLYYRTGLEKYRTWARTLADRFWRSPMMDEGRAYTPGAGGSWGTNSAYWPRSQGMMGMVMRALDGRPEMWPGLRKVVAMDTATMPGTTSGVRREWDMREDAYLLAVSSYCAMFDPDASSQASCRNTLKGLLQGFYRVNQKADGSWQVYYANSSSGDTNAPATLTHGSTQVTGLGTAWNLSSTGTTWIWFTNNVGYPATRADGDPVAYKVSMVDATHLLLDRPYEGTTGQHGWVISTIAVGWGAQPFMEGILAAAFDLAGKALADTDPVEATLAGQYAISAANWLKNNAYESQYKGMPYFTAAVNCPEACTAGSVEAARSYASDTFRGMMVAYDKSKDPDMKDFLDMLYSAMFSKPGTGGPNPDGTYLSCLDLGSWCMSVTPAQSKWFGWYFGFSDLPAWPGYRLGGALPADPWQMRVGFRLAQVQGASSVRVKSTDPTGKVTSTICTQSPCNVTIDRRLGEPLLQLEYLSSTNQVLASGDPFIGQLPGSGTRRPL